MGVQMDKRVHWRGRWSKEARRTTRGLPACNQRGKWPTEKWLSTHNLDEVTCKRCRTAIGLSKTIPVNQPFERVPMHEADPGFGPVPPRPKITTLYPKPNSEQPRITHHCNLCGQDYSIYAMHACPNSPDRTPGSVA